jgi:hypothetical protein
LLAKAVIRISSSGAAESSRKAALGRLPHFRQFGDSPPPAAQIPEKIAIRGPYNGLLQDVLQFCSETGIELCMREHGGPDNDFPPGFTSPFGLFLARVESRKLVFDPGLFLNQHRPARIGIGRGGGFTRQIG